MITLVIGAVCTAICIPLVNSLAVKLGIVAQPRKDRWHQGASIPRLGGIAIFIGAISFVVIHGPWQWSLGLSLIFATGLRDDIVPLSAKGKLAPQLFSALIIASSMSQVVGGAVLVVLATVWIIAAMNMYNMLDNMDGTAAATGAAIALSLTVLALKVGNVQAMAIGFALSGAILGFFYFNIAPARIFMGDCGSHFIGASLGLLALALVEEVGSIVILLFLIPILDFTYVTVKRLRERRSIIVGGRDHLAHDLHRRGFSEHWIMGIYAAMSLCVGYVVWAGL